jgi:protein gp37
MCNMNIPWHSNITLLVSVEDQATADERIPQLLQIPAHTRGVSVEPLLEPVDLRQYLPKLDWVIVGGETGKNARHSDPEWILSLEDQCREAGVPFFFKQWGTDGNGHKLQLAKCGLGLPRQYPKSLELK